MCCAEIYERPAAEDDDELYLNDVAMEQLQRPRLTNGPVATDDSEDDEYAAGQLYETDLMVQVQQSTDANVVAGEAGGEDKESDEDQLYINDAEIKRQQSTVSNGVVEADEGQDDIDDEEGELYQNDLTIPQQQPAISNGPTASTVGREDGESDEGELYQNVIAKHGHDDDRRETEEDQRKMEGYQNVGETGRRAERQRQQSGEDDGDEPVYQNVSPQATPPPESTC